MNYFHLRLIHPSTQVSATAGCTVAYVVDNVRDKLLLRVGFCWCHPADRYRRKKGRHVAAGMINAAVANGGTVPPTYLGQPRYLEQIVDSQAAVEPYLKNLLDDIQREFGYEALRAPSDPLVTA